MAGEIGIVHESPPSAGRFVGSILRDGNRVHAQILHKNVLLAAECLADTSTADRGLVDTVVEGLSRLATAHENRRLLQKSHDVLRDWSALSEASDVAARLASHLGSRDRAVRLCALEGLERLGVPDRHRAALLLSDDDPAVRARAARWLALEPDDEAIDRILEAYSIERDSIAQIELCSLLGELGSPRAIDALAKSLKGPAHVAAAYALLSCGGRQVLMEALQRRHPLAARGAAKALGDAGERAIAPLLAAIIQESSDARLVLTAAHGLIDLAIPGASDLIRAVVDDTSRPTEVRSMGAMALARVADVEDAPRLLGLVTGGHQRMRYDAARALGRINDPQVVAKLSEIARDGSEPSDVRMAALTSLGTLRSAFGFAEFTSILRDDADPCARAAAAWALAEVRLPFAVPELLTALEGDESLAVQMAASHALSVIAHADIIPRVEAILDGTHEFDRSFLALRVLGSHDAARAITRIVDHGDMDSPITAMLQVADAPRTRGELLWDLSLEAP